MLLINCPFCGSRSELEFRYAGEAHITRPAEPSVQTDQAWGAHLYLRSNPAGEHAERWRHIHGCGRFFNVVRDTTSDRILAAYPAGTSRPALSDPVTPGSGAFKDARPPETGV